MQAILGPNTIENGVNPDTAIMGFGDGMALLGPAHGPSNEVDPIAKFFLLLGKIISVRRLLDPCPPGVQDWRGPAEHPVRQYEAFQHTFLGFNEGEEFEVVWKPLADSIDRDLLQPIARQTAVLDYRTRRFFADETHAIFALDPTASVEQRMQALDQYLLAGGLTVEANSEGFHDFIKAFCTDQDGRRIDLPTSTNPSFPDKWITPDAVNPADYGGSRREWSLIW